MENFKKSWKTTTLGIIGLILVGCYLGNVITSEQLTVAIGTIGGLGLFTAKDSDK